MFEQSIFASRINCVFTSLLHKPGCLHQALRPTPCSQGAFLPLLFSRYPVMYGSSRRLPSQLCMTNILPSLQGLWEPTFSNRRSQTTSTCSAYNLIGARSWAEDQQARGVVRVPQPWRAVRTQLPSVSHPETQAKQVPAAGQGETGTYCTRGPGMWVPTAGQGEAGDLPYPRSRNAGAHRRPGRSGGPTVPAVQELSEE